MARYHKGLLWEVTATGGSTSHVFGSMHVRDPRAFHWKDQLLDTLADKDHFFAELALDSPEISDFDPVMPLGQCLHLYVSPAVWKRAGNFLKRIYGIDIGQLDHVYPLIALQEITRRQLSEEVPFILDEFLFTAAKERDIKVGGLETWKEQGSLIRSIPIGEQAKAFFDAIRHHRAFTRNLRKLIDDYQRQHIHQLYLRTRRNLGGMRKAMLFHRNELMADRMITNIQTGGKCFFCIGAAHLAGKKGVLNILGQHGCRIRRVEMN